MESGGCPAEVQFLGQGQEDLDVPNFHFVPIRVYHPEVIGIIRILVLMQAARHFKVVDIPTARQGRGLLIMSKE